MAAPAQALTDVIPDEIPFGVAQIEARLIELAKLKPLEYDRIREAEAKEMGVRVATLPAARVHLVSQRRQVNGWGH